MRELRVSSEAPRSFARVVARVRVDRGDRTEDLENVANNCLEEELHSRWVRGCSEKMRAGQVGDDLPD